jgi:hypothetical protein
VEEPPKAARREVPREAAAAPVAVKRGVHTEAVEEPAAAGVAKETGLEDRKMLRDKTGSENPLRFGRALATFMTCLITIAACGAFAAAQDIKQKMFKSPEQAFKAVVAAAGANDTKALLAIFGPEGKEIISSGDAVADERARERFVRAAGEGITFSKLNSRTVRAVIGKDGWSFPVLMVKSGKGWSFATKEGKEEILTRRIGRNELNTIEVCRTYVAAQREYAAKDRNGDGVLQFAQHFLSSKDREDGLYWEAAPGEEMSPLGPLIARASQEGYPVTKKNKKHRPYHGYYFKILKRQGGNAPGGEMNYVKDGKMVGGFALVAYPAIYGVSGVMTFMVNQAGIVYQKNLGPKTEQIAKAITQYDPDNTWIKVEAATTVSSSLPAAR